MDTENWLNWNGDLDNPNESKDNKQVDDESDVEYDNSIEDLVDSEWQNVSAAPNTSELTLPLWRLMKLTDKVLMPVDTMYTRRNKVSKTKWDRMRPCIFTSIVVLFD